MQEINWNVTSDEANVILLVLGDLPTKTGVYPLVVKLKEQTDSQVKTSQSEE